MCEYVVARAANVELSHANACFVLSVFLYFVRWPLVLRALLLLHRDVARRIAFGTRQATLLDRAAAALADDVALDDLNVATSTLHRALTIEPVCHSGRCLVCVC